MLEIIASHMLVISSSGLALDIYNFLHKTRSYA